MGSETIYITQLIFITPGQESAFDQFETLAIPIIAKYNGRMLLRVRPGAGSYLEGSMEQPYEIHLVEFDAEADFTNFMQDEERKKFLYLKEQSIRTSILIKGRQL